MSATVFMNGTVVVPIGWIGIALMTFPWPLLAEEAAPLVAVDSDGLHFFETKIRPILAQRCYECHSASAKKSQGGLQVDTKASFLAGGDSGPAIVPGKPQESLLIAAIGYDGDIQMPPDGKLPAAEIALLTTWVQRAALLPDDTATAAVKKKIDYTTAGTFWSFQPVRAIAPPPVVAWEWVQRPVDAFVLASLEQQKLKPALPADRRTLLRRVSFDLIGLPPTPEEIEQFEQDSSSDAYPQLVERLLSSAHYGERWGRHWLDLARYSDEPAPWDTTNAQAWLYRDWVVEAFNADMHYDEFVRHQLATDLMPDSTSSNRAALGFIGMSPVYWKELQLDKEVIKVTVADEWEERVDAVSRTFLGLSVACARCHDHKFDPISAEDYYAIAGVLANTRLIDLPMIPGPEGTLAMQAVQQAAKLKAEIKAIEELKPPPADRDQKIAEIKKQIATAEQTPHYSSPLAFGVDDAALEVLADGPNRTKLEYSPGKAQDLNVHIRGNPSNVGPVVPRRFLTVLSSGTSVPFQVGSGRLELAESILTAGAPLSARVIVNRVWKQHFGRGLVETASDFGTQGSAPTHPDLLTDLTHRFIQNGWSIKWLHREIMLSATYQQSSDSNPSHYAADPDNRFYWRMTRRRLDVEAWRDAMLFVCGLLDPRLGGPPTPLSDAGNNRRTLYGSIDRYEVDDMLRLNDFPDAFTHSPNREPTTTAIQQLVVLNSPFLERLAAALAARISAPLTAKASPAAASTGSVPEAQACVHDKIHRAYLLLFGREPSEREMQIGETFLSGGQTDQQPLPELWQQYAQALLGSNEFLFID